MISSEELSAIISRLRSQGTDDSKVEIKRCANTLSRDVWESVSAFANTAGGLIILGLAEDQGFVPAKDFDIDRVRDQFVSGIGDGGTEALIQHAPHYELSRGIVNGSQVLIIEIKELDIKEKPCYIKARGIQSGSYKRVDDKDIRLSPTELYEMQSILIPSNADGEVVPEATVEDLDEELVEAIIANRRKQSPRALRGVDSREQQLSRLNITNRTGQVRLAGLLATGVYPQQYYPKLVIDVASHPGVEKSDPDAPRFLDRQQCDGPMGECIEDALMAIRRNLRVTSYVVGAGRQDELEIPEEALREALSNAVIHREYSAMFLGESISVDIYTDRVEVTSPGGLWGGKTIENLDNGDSRCRNAKLMNLMGAVPLRYERGYVAESQGSGIKAMIRLMKSRALGAPEFKATADSFKVIFARYGAESVRNQKWLAGYARRELSRRERTVAMLLHEQGKSLGIKEMRAALDWDSDDIREVCDSLEKAGLIERTGREEFRLTVGSKTSDADAKPARTRGNARALGERILGVMTPGVEISARDLALMLDVNVSQIRYALPALLKEGRVMATASEHNRNRRYVLP